MTGRTQRATGPIVVGVDGAEASLAAVRWAAQEASWYQARVHLVFVSPRYRRAWYASSPEVPPGAEGDTDGRALLAAAQLEAARALTPDRMSSEVAAGSPARVLLDWSATAELLVLGAAYQAGSSGNLSRSKIGSASRPAVLRGVRLRASIR
jgi:nucleotide-binding universal stress UspA family protein